MASINLSFEFKYRFCRTNNNQKMADKMATAFPFALVDTLVIYYLIASKFHIWITFIKLSHKLEYGLCPITKMVAKMAATCQFALVDTLT